MNTNVENIYEVVEGSNSTFLALAAYSIQYESKILNTITGVPFTGLVSTEATIFKLLRYARAIFVAEADKIGYWGHS